MAVICNACGYDKNPDDAEFCDACGIELNQTVSNSNLTTPSIPNSSPISTPSIASTPTPSTPIFTSPIASTVAPSSPTLSSPSIAHPAPVRTGNAKLIAKQVNAPVPEFEVKASAIIGTFDTDMGPVDIDLEQFQGGETVSRNHAEIYQEGGEWKIKDLGSSNGIFIKPVGQTRFNARITTPVQLYSGDEIAIAKVLFLFQSP